MEQIFQELVQQKNVRSNLSSLRQFIKVDVQRERLKQMIERDEGILLRFLHSDDAKTRKNAALLLGELQEQRAAEALFEAYQSEETLFVKSAYLEALSHLEIKELLPFFQKRIEELRVQEFGEAEQKHISEELRSLRKILIRYEGIVHHTFCAERQELEILLVTNRLHREFIRRMVPVGNTSIHPLGVLVRTKHLEALSELRLYRELLFPIHTEGLLPQEPKLAAKTIWDSDFLSLLMQMHQEGGAFYFRVECKSTMNLEERSAFTKKFSMELERLSGGKLINSTSDYEVELRLFADREGRFFPCLKCCMLKDKRFSYRKNAIAASIHPSTAALMMELAKPYLKERAQIMDPFCGVGTMLIERDKLVRAGEIYATDIFADAIVMGRENAALAEREIHFIHRDFMDFTHEYLFDELITNMPIRGKKSKEELDSFYAEFFAKALELLKREAVVIMYTNELGFVKKQMRLHKEFTLLQETCMQKKSGFYLLVIGFKRVKK